MNILFTGVGRRIELLQAFRSAALVLHKELKIFGADMAGTAPALAYCDYTRKTVAMKDPAYISDLLRICQEDQIDLLIPTIDTDLLVLAENREIFQAAGTRVMISAPEMVRICRDKNYTSRFFADLGLQAPMPVNDWKAYAGGYPAFIKPKDGSSSVNAFKVENAEELAVYAAEIDDYIIQPFVDGTEYTIDIFCNWDGIPLSVVPRERTQVRAGEVNKTKIELDQVMIEEAKAICRRFKPCGPITVQLIREKVSGTDYYIEINPRFGGGAPLSMKAGARSAEMILKLLDGEEVPYCSSVADGAVYSRFDQSVCISEGESAAVIKGVIFDLDDTLYSEKEYVRSGFKAVSDRLGGGYEEQLWQYFQDGVPAIDELLKGLGCPARKAELLTVYREHMPRLHLYEGVSELIDRLKAEGKKVGIITDGRPEGQRGKLKALGLDHLVDDCIITDELGGAQFRKPCDIAFRILQMRWELDPSEMVYVGDNSGKDFQAPRQLGMHCIWMCQEDGLYNKAGSAAAKSFLQPEKTCCSVAELSRLL